jgi:protease IV
MPPAYPPAPTYGWPPPSPYGAPPQGTAPSRSGTGRRIFMALLLVFLLLSVGLNLILIFSLALVSGDSGVITTTVVSGDADQEVAVLPLTGEIGERTAQRMDRYFTRIANDTQVKAVVLEIDSPGGTVSAADEIYRRILRYKDERTAKKLPAHVIVSMRARATSGGYYAACAGDHVFAEPTTLTGNIGVLLPRYNFSKLMEKYGVEEKTIVSTGSTYKNVGSPFSPEDEGKAGPYLQTLADNAMDQFKKVVEQGRGSRLTGSKEDLYSGKVFVASDALKAGLIDQIGYPRDAYQHAAKVANLGKPNIIRYQEPTPSLLGLLSSRSIPDGGADGATEQPVTVDVNGMQVKVGPDALDALRTPRLLYR